MQPNPNLENVEPLSAEEVLSVVLSADPGSRPCMTCSFQAEDMIVLRMLKARLPEIPVLFLDTGYHFAQTYQYRDRMTKEWALNLTNVLPKNTVEQQESLLGILNRTDPTQCCQLRKVEPLMEALGHFEIWFTGLRREQSPTRKNLKKVEHHRLPGGKTLWEYTGAKGLSYLPQYDEGYASIGCEPCTAIPEDPNNPRSGRWSGKKLECGIHTFSELAE